MGKFIALGLVMATLMANPHLDKSKLLARRWILVDLNIPRLEKNFQLRGISDERRAAVMQSWVEGSYIHFKSDGTYEVSILGSEPEVMLWQLNPEETKILVKKKQTEESKLVDIEVLSKEQLVMILPDINGDFTRMYFKPEE